jgi:hypothetical protein
MLKLTKNQIVPGQQVVVSNLDKVAPRYSDLEYAQSAFKKIGCQDGDLVTINKLTGGVVNFTFKNNKCQFYWSWFKQVTDVFGENLGLDNTEYVIFLDGKRYKTKKYKDIGKVKAGLLVMMNYHDLFYKESRKHLENCPELEYIETPYWISGDTLTKEEFEKVEIYKWANRKLGEKVTDFNPMDFYNEQMFLIKVSSKFGSVAREVFKKVNDTHQYMFVFMHEDYNKKYADFESMKESDIIKNVLSTLKLKGSCKSTKSGKTAIAVTSSTDAVRISKLLPEGSKYMILDMKGTEMVRRENELFTMEAREEKLNQLFS